MRVLDGGLQKWMDEGKPTVKDAEVINETDFDYIYNGDSVMDYEDIVKARDDGSVQIVDIRSDQMVKGAGKIPNSIHIETVNFFAKEGDLKSAEEINKIFEEKNVDISKPMVFTCNMGIQATIGKAAAEKAGATGQTYLYDGSQT